MKMSHYFIGLCIASVAAFGWADNLQSRVDRNQIGLNETLNLVLEYDERVDTQSLDFAGLRQDFDILNSSTASQVSIVNGRQDVSTRWTLVLLPKHTGQLVVPSFQINGNYSEAIAVEVTQTSSTGSRSQPLNVEIEVSRESVLTQQQLLLTVRLTASNQVSNLSGDTLTIEGAQVNLLDQKQFSQVHNGVSWQVIEWKYAVFADQPGTLEIPGQVFSGVVGSTRSVFDPFGGGGQRTLARSTPLSVTVNAAPVQRNWFPAAEVKIESEWPDAHGGNALNEIHVGEPVTRSVTVTAQGQRPETIPPLPSAASDSFKVYADQPELLVQTTANNLIGIRRESTAIVPTRVGDLVLPEIRIPWWDTDESVWKEAVLPAQTLTILPAKATEALAPPVGEAAAPSPSATAVQNTAMPLWQWVSAGLALLCFVLLWLLVQGKPGPKDKVEIEPANRTEQKLWAQLQREFSNANPKAIRSSLENWCHCLWPEESASALSKLSQKLSEPARQELQLLERRIYGTGDQEELLLSQLIAELKALRKDNRAHVVREAALPPLYPE